MVLRGFSFSPLTVMVEPVLPTTEPEKEAPLVKPRREKEEIIVETPPAEKPVYKTEAGEKAWYKKWWVWAIVGGGAVAVVAASGSSKDEGGGAPPTGSVTISAPVP